MAITTKFWTWTEIWAKIKSEHDIDDEDDFIDEAEAMGYANDAIDEAEAGIATIYEDYFLSRASLTLVSGQDEIAMPGTIYAHKIRKIIYFNGSIIYQVARIRGLDKFLEYRHSRYNPTNTAEYRYFIENSTAGSPKILISPVAYESGDKMEIWFIRQANRIATGTDVVDIPEFASFVMDFLRERIEAKRGAGSPRHQATLMKLNGSPDGTLTGTRQLMIDTLTAMVPDGDNEIIPDYSPYNDMN